MIGYFPADSDSGHLAEQKEHRDVLAKWGNDLRPRASPAPAGDIWLGYYKAVAKYRWTIWRRRLDHASDDRPLTKGKVYANEEEAQAALMEIRRALHHGQYHHKVLFPEIGIEKLPDFELYDGPVTERWFCPHILSSMSADRQLYYS